MAWQIISIVLCAISTSAVRLGCGTEVLDAQSPILNSANQYTSGELPIVDLGYTRHQAVKTKNKDLYKFKNIRYAAPPTGNLRFRAPQPPLHDRPGQVRDGSGGKECFQAMPKWKENFPPEPCEECECCLQQDAKGKCTRPCVKSKNSNVPPNQMFGGFLPPILNWTNPKHYSEDCLYLDVWAPKDVFHGDQKKPVFVWIYGGAYVFGTKSLYNPSGLMERAKLENRGGMIFVAMNYRMGALGFAAGEGIEDKDLNAGLLDQYQALQWVQDHIEKFGGDPKQVTIAGLSAGGGSVFHQLTAYAGEREALFQRAISLSGGWQPIVDETLAKSAFRDFMKQFDNVHTIEDLRDEKKVSELQMIKANYEQIKHAPPGSLIYNPIAWGEFTPKSPPKLLKEGSFLTNVDVIASHVFDEGGLFANIFAEKGTNVRQFLDFAFKNITEEEREWILQTYHTDTNDAEDIARIIGDVTFRCHVTYTSDAKSRNLWRQRWNTARSSSHGGDLMSLFYRPTIPVTSIRSALILQDYVVTFTISGSPSTEVVIPSLPDPIRPAKYMKHSEDDKIQFFDSTVWAFPNIRRDEVDFDEVCRKWQDLSCT